MGLRQFAKNPNRRSERGFAPEWSFAIPSEVMSIPFAKFLPQMNAVIRVVYDLFGNSFYLNTLPSTTFTEEELQTLVAVNFFHPSISSKTK